MAGCEPWLTEEAQFREPQIFLALEYQLQRQLCRARAADLVQRIEAAGLAAGAERCSEHLGGLAEERRAHIVGRRAEIGVVEDVEEIGARLEGEALIELELPAQRQIDLGRAESVEDVAAESSLNGARGDAERGFVDALAGRRRWGRRSTAARRERDSGAGRCCLPRRNEPNVFCPVTTFTGGAPPDPTAATNTLTTELARLRVELDTHRTAAEKARVAADERDRARLTAEQQARQERNDRAVEAGKGLR